MKVGDLVVQIGWEADGTGIVIEVDDGFAGVLFPFYWPGGIVNMCFGMLEVVSESR